MITTVQPSWDTAKQNSAIIRALGSITTQQAETIVRAVQTGSRAWDVQVTNDYDGYLAILVEPFIQGDEQKAFYIAGTAQRLELFEAHDDTLVPVAAFDDAQRLSIQLLDLIGQQWN